MLNLFFWLIFGVLAGWIDALTVTVIRLRFTLLQITVGGIGGLVGGLGWQSLSGAKLVGPYNGTGIIASVIVAVVFILSSSYLTGHRGNKESN